MNPLSLLTGGVWQYVAIGAGVIIVGLGVTIAVVDLDRAHLRGEVATLTDRIENPQTGYIARLTQAQANEAVLKSAITDQNTAIEAQASTTQLHLAAAQKALDMANAKAAVAQQQVAKLLTAPLVGKDVCTRLGDADKRLLETLQ